MVIQNVLGEGVVSPRNTSPLVGTEPHLQSVHLVDPTVMADEMYKNVIGELSSFLNHTDWNACIGTDLVLLLGIQATDVLSAHHLDGTGVHLEAGVPPGPSPSPSHAWICLPRHYWETMLRLCILYQIINDVYFLESHIISVWLLDTKAGEAVVGVSQVAHVVIVGVTRIAARAPYVVEVQLIDDLP